MRTVVFKKVVDAVIRLHGMNAKVMNDYDTAEALVDHVNSRVEQAILAWDWPEWNVTEERAFRQVWEDDKQYFRVNTSGVPDEVYYLVNGLYYQVNPLAAIDPPVGTTPTSIVPDPGSGQMYFTQLTTVDAYIEYDQPCKRSIGQVMGVYSVDPRTVGCCAGPWLLKYHPSEKGIDVCSVGPTVFILYQMPTPTYSMLPHMSGHTHQRGDVVLDEVTTECFQAITATNASPNSFPAAWRYVPFLEKWFDFVRWGAFADSLGEIDQGNSIDPNVRAGLRASAEGKAMDSIQRQIDSLTMQGQKLRWNFGRKRYWCESVPWTGGNVTTLTDACEDDLGWIPPAPPSQPGVTDEYHPEIRSLTTDIPALNGLSTLLRAANSLVKIVIIPDGSTYVEQQVWRLQAGTAQVGNPGQINPLDYNATVNPKFWNRIM